MRISKKALKFHEKLFPGYGSQLKGHLQGNLNVGNDKETLLGVITQLLPYAGYPRTLNALSVLNEVAPDD